MFVVVAVAVPAVVAVGGKRISHSIYNNSRSTAPAAAMLIIIIIMIIIIITRVPSCKLRESETYHAKSNH